MERSGIDKKTNLSVSVIMPVYNSAEYLADAVDSILLQTFPNFELILVDDGSTDGSGTLCDEMAHKDSRILVIHKENGGICSARNAGLDAATGEYVAFCDNDDKYLPDLLHDNIALAKEHNADVVRFKRLKIARKADGRLVKTSDELKTFAVLTGREEIGKNYRLVRSSFLGVWTGLYRREMIRRFRIRFPEFMKYGQEDGYFNYECYSHASCIVLNPRIYYYWMQREEHSTTGRFHKNLIESMIHNMRKEWKLLEDLDVYSNQPDCFYQCVRNCLVQVFAYIDQKKSPYGPVRKAGILREVCRRIPQPLKIESTSDAQAAEAMRRSAGWRLYMLYKREGIEW
ncbi:MAG: glycosyltransferase [Lachnospiraceae bacterium]|nr:glycosyltransferase [Lachnospiraceae bacterium]